tara:strand:- start:1529 stop:1846 length:318 start_codon:yes stop_codon:yes gene_type:complete
MSSKSPEFSKEDLDKVYRSIVTKLSQALLEAEGLVIIGAKSKKNANHYIEEEVADQLSGLLEKINSRRLAHKYGLKGENVDENIIFLEEHPAFLLRKFLDKLNDI